MILMSRLSCFRGRYIARRDDCKQLFTQMYDETFNIHGGNSLYPYHWIGGGFKGGVGLLFLEGGRLISFELWGRVSKGGVVLGVRCLSTDRVPL